jgi:hypothetical protein
MRRFFRVRKWTVLQAVAAGALLSASDTSFAQEFILPVQSLDREVIFKWTKAPEDTFTIDERRKIEQVAFFAARNQGYLPNSFANGSLITGRGALVLNTNESDIEVGNAGELYTPNSPPPPPPPAPSFDVAGVFQFGRNLIGVAYSQPVDPATALALGNYSFSPPIALTEVRLQDNGQTAILVAGSTLTPGDYTLTIGAVTNADGAPLGGAGSYPFTAPNVASPLNISEVNAGGSPGATVTVFGQVTIPTGSRDVTQGNGFIQDGSGQGIRLRGLPIVNAVNARGNAVTVTGTLFSAAGFEITNYTATLLASGLPFLGAKIVRFDLVDDPSLAGAYIQTTGHLSRVDANADPDQIHYFTVTLDTLFAGYQIWRAETEDPTKYELLRTYSLLDSTWTFVGDVRAFDDPDSIIARGTLPPDRNQEVAIPGPFNGFTYLYAITKFNAVVDATVFPFRVTTFDTLRGENGVISPEVRPSQVARLSHPLLSQVRVVPNPYNPSAHFGQQEFPGAPRVQFVNLPPKAVIKIFTVAGDEVRQLDKTENVGTDAVDWDLKNANGHDVAPGIYVYTVQAEGELITGHFVIAR